MIPVLLLAAVLSDVSPVTQYIEVGCICDNRYRYRTELEWGPEGWQLAPPDRRQVILWEHTDEFPSPRPYGYIAYQIAEQPRIYQLDGYYRIDAVGEDDINITFISKCYSRADTHYDMESRSWHYWNECAKLLGRPAAPRRRFSRPALAR